MLVPDLVTAFTRPPVKPPCRTSYGATRIWNSCTASMLIGRPPFWPPGAPVDPRPKRSLLIDPSIWMLLNRLLVPPPEGPPLGAATTCGEVTIRSVKLRFWEGRFRIAVAE